MALQEGVVDISGEDRKIWLVKIPSFVYEEWQKGKDDAVLGTVVMEGKNLKYCPAPTEKANQVSEFKLATNPTSVQNLFVFKTEELPKSNDEEKKNYSISIQGKISTSCTMAPPLSKQYGSVVKEREIKANEPTNKTKKLKDTRAETRHLRPLAQPYPASSRRVEAQKEKAARMNKQDLEELLFVLFRRKRYWKLNDLVSETEQPIQYLKKDFLEEMCIYNRKGEHKGEWQLKEDYNVGAAEETEPKKAQDTEEVVMQVEDDWM
jgi:transcription initiation factor TFIIF subunit beta